MAAGRLSDARAALVVDHLRWAWRVRIEYRLGCADALAFVLLAFVQKTLVPVS